MTRIAVVDPSFHWPPSGGSWVDIREVSIRLIQAGHDVHIFTVRHDDYFMARGRIAVDPGVPVTALRLGGNHRAWLHPLKQAVDAFQPDKLFITNTFSLGPDLVETFRRYPVYLRIYGFELACPNYMSVRRNTRVCEWHRPVEEPVCQLSYLWNPVQCTACAMRSFVHLFNYLKRHREPMNPFAAEYFHCRGFLPGFYRKTARSLRRAKAVIVSNEFIRGKYALPGVNTVKIPGGVDLAIFHPDDSDPKPRRILMAGRCQDPRKGFSVFRDAMERLRSGMPDIEPVVTDPSAEDPAAGIQSTGWTDFKDMPGLYRSAAVTVVPTTWPEPFGLVAVESMACGTPVVVSDIGGLTETVLEGETGFRFPMGDAGALASAVEKILRSEDLRQRLSTAAAGHVRARYDWDSVVEKYYLPMM